MKTHAIFLIGFILGGLVYGWYKPWVEKRAITQYQPAPEGSDVMTEVWVEQNTATTTNIGGGIKGPDGSRCYLQEDDSWICVK